MKKRLAQADCDIDLALQYKNDYPEIAKVQYNASVEEMNQFRSQHEAIIQLISNFKKEGHEVPVAMQAIYDYLHEEYMKCAAEIKIKQELFK